MATLATIAADMKRVAGYTGTCTRNLSGGLELRLERRRAPAGHYVWVLRLDRPVSVPSLTEIKLCRVAFGVPDSAEASDTRGALYLEWPIA